MANARDVGVKSSGDGEAERVHGVIRSMDKDERLFIKDLPIASSLPPIDVPALIKKGLVANVGKWAVLTPRGGNVVATRDLPKEVQFWFQILSHVPKRSALANLEQKGVIENRAGLPALTAFGENVKEQLHIMEEYRVHNSWRVPAESSDKDSLNPM